jgi:hypothetical protein
MPDLEFAVLGAKPVSFCVTPTLAFPLRVTNVGGDPIHAVALDCQVRIEAQRRRYDEVEKEQLVELFGEPTRWSQTLRSLLWTHAAVSVPPFETVVEVDLHVPCTADFNVLAGKYFSGLDPSSTVPISLLFSGSIFYGGENGGLQVTRIPWSAEATYELPIATWKDLLQMYYPNTAWLTLRRDAFDSFYAYKTRRGFPTSEQALEELLKVAAEEAPR